MAQTPSHAHAFVDESGDAGLKFDKGSSPYFVVTAVVFQDEAESQKCLKAIESKRVDLRMSPRAEFHFNKCSHSWRTQFLNAVLPFEFHYSTVVIDKHRLSFPSRSPNRAIMDRLSFHSAIELASDLTNASVTADQSSGLGFGESFIRQLRSHWKSQGFEIPRLRTERSESNPLIQIADMICGAEARSLKDRPKGENYRELIASHRKRLIRI